MADSYDLTQLDSHSFEHLVNFLALKVLGNGVTGFATGADGGRDGYLKGRAPYPTENDAWEGVWFLQSKFHKPHLSKDPQKWIINEVRKEIAQFENGNRPNRPNIWIIASNIEPSGVPETGAFDKIKELVFKLDPNINIDIWGGRRILDFLLNHPEAVANYGHFLTPGHIITKLYQDLKKHDKNVKEIINHFIINQFHELSYTKLEQAGSGSDQRPKIYELFRDLPVTSHNKDIHFIMNSLVSASKNVQKNSTWNNFGHGWKEWSRNPMRARILLLKGGPGQGKSTAGQYFGQLQRAAYILSDNGPNVTQHLHEIATELKGQASKEGYWPAVPRIPISIELKDFANWYSSKNEHDARNIVEYLCDKIRIKTSKLVTAEIMHEAFSLSTWFANFDGLDEVPNDLKDQVAEEIITFANELIPELNADFLMLCTTRPQGYSGQFENLYSATVTLSPLPPKIALECASAVVKFNRSEDEALEAIKILEYAMESDQVRELMTTPLQSHIMAVVVRDGGRPPEKRWELFNNFYNVMKKRESQKNFPDIRISALLRDRDQLLKSIHDRLGVCLHTKSENSKGAEATFEKSEFYHLAKQTTAMQIDGDTDDVVDTLMEATTERLVFVNTPESNEFVRFDIRQLQEFFAAEFIYNAVSSTELRRRLDVICGDPHWREVVHFLLSALAHNKILSELSIAVQIIQQLDDDAENHRIKTFKKRMGTGSLLTLRLVEEGVLEQDKRIRYQFNSTLTPLWNNLDREVLNRITQIKKEQSRSWLINNMVEAFIGLDYSEHIALGYLLAIMLPSDHVRIEEVKQRLLYATDYYFSATFKINDLDDYHDETENVCKKWFIELICNLVMQPNKLRNKTQLEMIEFLVRNLHIIKNDTNLLIPQELFEILDFLDTKKNHDRHKKIKDMKDEKKYCFVSTVNHDVNWKSASKDEKIMSIRLSHEMNSSSLNLIKAAIRYGQSASVENYRSILEQLRINDFDDEILPSKLKALIPLSFDDVNIKGHVEYLDKLDDESLKEVITNGKLGDMEIAIAIDFVRLNETPFSQDGWTRFCRDFPKLAMNLCSGPFVNFPAIQKAKSEHSKEFYSPIVKIAKEHTNIFAAYPLFWGEVFSVYPEHESEIREKLLYTPIHKSSARFDFLTDKTLVIKIDIEKEKNLLINFARVLLQYRLGKYMTPDLHHIPSTERADESLLSAIGISNEFLISIFTCTEEKEELRTAAIICYLTQPFENKTVIISEFFSYGYDVIMLDLLKSGNQEMLTESIYVFLYDAPTYDSILMDFLGHVTIITKEDYSSRVTLHNIYQRWRERSFAPVQKHNVLDSWLSYTY
ncbi:NACHT domain-containing protein [Pectobacterium carotovorum]|uniref:NACHT domain-containing protein n=1 Tax=Pectobacterium carotovorum TaxID=554 RepID=UPI00387352C2